MRKTGSGSTKLDGTDRVFELLATELPRTPKTSAPAAETKTAEPPKQP